MTPKELIKELNRLKKEAEKIDNNFNKGVAKAVARGIKKDIQTVIDSVKYCIELDNHA